MSQAKFVLSAAALVISAVGSFAFRSTKTNNHKLYTTTNIKRGSSGFCQTVRCFTLASGTPEHKCKPGVIGTNYYTNVNNCTNKWSGGTTSTL
jgi:hypothetical protein